MSRVLTVDVGNTTTNIGQFSIEHAEGPSPASNPEPTLLGSCALTTPARITADEARIQLKQALALMPNDPLDGVVLSCVVPTLTDSWRTALARACSSRPLVIGPGIKTGVRMNYDDPAEVGPDRIADVVAARATYGSPVLAIDLGTTTNFEAIDDGGAFAGGIIAPGVALGARRLRKPPHGCPSSSFVRRSASLAGAPAPRCNLAWCSAKPLASTDSSMRSSRSSATAPLS